LRWGKDCVIRRADPIVRAHHLAWDDTPRSLKIAPRSSAAPMEDKPTHTRVIEPCIAGLVIIGIGLMIWWPALSEGFAQDDGMFLEWATSPEGNPSRIINWLMDYGPVDDNFRPLSTRVYFGTLFALFGQDPQIYHSVNILLHLAHSLLLMMLIMQLGGSVWIGAGCGLMFVSRSMAFVPVHWVSAIQELLPTTLGLLAMSAGIHACREKMAAQKMADRKMAARKMAARSLLSPLLIFLALLCKEVSIALVLGIPLVQWSLRPPDTPRRFPWASLGLHLLAGLAALGLRQAIIHGHGDVYTFSVGLDTIHREFRLLTWTLKGTYQLSALMTWGLGGIVIGGCLAIGIAGSSTEHRQPSPSLAVLLTALGCALPMAFLVGRDAQYYAYLPGAFFVLSLGLCAQWLESRWPDYRDHLILVTIGILTTSLVLEYRSIRNKAELRFVPIQRSMPSPGSWPALDRYQLVPNPRFEWSGGHLNVTYAAAVNRFLGEFERQLPTPPPADLHLILVGWREIYIASSLRSGGQTLERTSCLESTLRARFRQPAWTLSILDSLDPDPPPRYRIEPGAIVEQVTARPESTRVLFVHPFTGEILNGPSPAQASIPFEARLRSFHLSLQQNLGSLRLF